MSVARLFEGAHLRAEIVRAGHRRLMVSFDWRVVGRDGFSEFSPNRNFLAGGFDQLWIGSAANDWFVNPETEALEAALAGIANGYDEVRAIGFSMGGYGAFRLSRSLGITRVVAVSPQLSISQRHAPFEWRYRTEAKTFDADLGDLSVHADPGLAGHVLVDDLNAADLAHAHALQALCPALRLVRLTGGGHPATLVLREARRAGKVQHLAMDPARGLVPLLAAHRAARAGQAGYWTRLALAAEPRRPACADAARLRARALEGSGGG